MYIWVNLVPISVKQPELPLQPPSCWTCYHLHPCLLILHHQSPSNPVERALRGGGGPRSEREAFLGVRGEKSPKLSYVNLVPFYVTQLYCFMNTSTSGTDFGEQEREGREGDNFRNMYCRGNELTCLNSLMCSTFRRYKSGHWKRSHLWSQPQSSPL